MNVNFALLCDYALQSADGKVSLLGVFTRVIAPQIPVTLPRAYFVFELWLDYEEVGSEFDIRVECVDPEGAVILKTGNRITIRGTASASDRLSVPQILQLPPTIFENAGAHEFNVYVGDDPSPKAHTSFLIVVAPVSTGEQIDPLPPPTAPAS